MAGHKVLEAVGRMKADIGNKDFGSWCVLVTLIVCTGVMSAADVCMPATLLYGAKTQNARRTSMVVYVERFRAVEGASGCLQTSSNGTRHHCRTGHWDSAGRGLAVIAGSVPAGFVQPDRILAEAGNL